MNSSPFKCSVFWASLVLVVAALFIWNGRQERRLQAAVEKQQIQTQRASALLFRTFHTDNYLTYSALSKTTARMGDEEMESVARIIHAPRRLSIAYIQGDHAGLRGGYNEHWSWRQVNNAGPTIPYAELERPADELAAQRFALLLENYRATWKGTEIVSGRKVDVVQLSPMQRADGARGPARKLWIDAETGLTLRQKSYNYQMMPVMESVLSEVDYAPQISETTFVTPQNLKKAAQTTPWMVHDSGNHRERVAQLSGLEPPQPKVLPPGFHFDSVGAHRCQMCQNPCYAGVSRYTDGLNTLTIFAVNLSCPNFPSKNAKAIAGQSGSQTKKSAEPSILPPDDFGSGTMVMREAGEGHLVAVSDLPAPMLRRVLDSTTLQAYNSPTLNSAVR